MTFREAAQYLDSFINYEKTPLPNYKKAFTLNRIECLLELLGNPHKGLKVIHVAGTKGKGSTAALIASMLKQGRFTVGLYTSPHLMTFRERIMVNNKMISERSFSKLLTRMKPYLELMRDKDLSFFEILTAAALLYFKQKRVNFAVLEVGLGGRLDATNVTESMISVITPISREHTSILGSTVARIAREKAGIIKKGSICVSSPQADSALNVIEGICKKTGVRLYLTGRDTRVDDIRFNRDKQYFSISGEFEKYPRLELRLRGEHQIANARTAVGVIEALRECNIPVSQKAVRKGIAKAEWPGRMEVIKRKPLVVVDGAQNVASARALIMAVERHFNYKKLILVLGISSDKDINGICKVLTKKADYNIVTRADNPRAASPAHIAEYISNRPVRVYMNSKDALKKAYSIAGRDDLILIAGSLYLVGEIKRNIREI